LQPKTVAWSKSKEKREKKKKQKDLKTKKRKRTDADDDDNEDLANDIRLMKKLKSGKVDLLYHKYYFYVLLRT